MVRERFVKICPKCGSKEVANRGMISRTALSPDYVCQSCGFQGPLFPEIKAEEAKKIPDKPRDFTPSQLPVFADKSEKPRKSKSAAIIGFVIMIFVLLSLLFFG